MKIAAIIPARFDSTRFPGKPLVKIAGISMIQRVYRQVEKADVLSPIIVATDDQRITQEVRKFGGHVVMTDHAHPSGTDRLWEVMKDSDFDGAVNIQGDEPLISEQLIRSVYDELCEGRCLVVTASFYNRSVEDYLSPHVVKVVMDRDSRALYFSRTPIPFCKETDFDGFNQHIGIYGYKRTALEKFVNLSQSALEKRERLEQLRFLENGISLAVVESRQPSYGVDTPDDIKKIESLLQQRADR